MRDSFKSEVVIRQNHFALYKSSCLRDNVMVCLQKIHLGQCEIHQGQIDTICLPRAGLLDTHLLIHAPIYRNAHSLFRILVNVWKYAEWLVFISHNGMNGGKISNPYSLES